VLFFSKGEGIMKKAITVIFDKVDKSIYATFDSVEEMNIAVRKHIESIEQSELKPSWKTKLIKLLKHLKQYSCVHVGLSYIKQSVLAETFNLKKADTVGTWIKKLSELNIVKVIPTKRSSSMQQTVNFVQIIPVTENRGQEEVKKGEQENTISLKQNQNNQNNVREESPTVEQLDHTFLSSELVPEQFIKTCKPFFGAKMIHHLFKRVELAHRQSGVSSHVSETLQQAISAFKQTVYAYKSKRIKKTFSGYFFRILEASYSASRRREVAMNTNAPAWLVSAV
jgi:hypothetical protein